MTIANQTDSPPDWSNAATEFVCPLCEYNLRGLVDPRCPECGFTFRWAELIDGHRTKHPYLFEHQNRRNIWSFWKTYSRDCWPGRFWKELNPAQPVRLGRLLVYWLLANLFVVLSIVPMLVDIGVKMQQQNEQFRTALIGMGSGVSVSRLDQMYPVKPWTTSFLSDLYGRISPKTMEALIAPGVMLIAWPWLSFAALMVFRTSMRRAKVNKRHVLRAVVYSCDFSLSIILVTVLGSPLPEATGWLLVIALACATLTLYRLNIAYSKYLRFHLPFHTVLASQLIVFLFTFIVLLQSGLLRSML